MAWKKALAIAAIAAISFTGNYLISSRISAANTEDAMSIYASSWHSKHGFAGDWCNPANFDRISWMASWAMSDLDLTNEQQAKFDAVLAASKQNLTKAETICSTDRETVKALPAPEQLEKLRAMLVEAEQVIAGISGPFAEFHASLSPEQTEKLKTLMNHEGGHGRWHRRGG